MLSIDRLGLSRFQGCCDEMVIYWVEDTLRFPSPGAG